MDASYGDAWHLVRLPDASCPQRSRLRGRICTGGTINCTRNTDSNADPNANTITLTNSDADADSDSQPNSNAYTYAYADSDTHTYSNSAPRHCVRCGELAA